MATALDVTGGAMAAWRTATVPMPMGAGPAAGTMVGRLSNWTSFFLPLDATMVMSPPGSSSKLRWAILVPLQVRGLLRKILRVWTPGSILRCIQRP